MERFESIVLEHFDAIRKEIDDVYDTFIESDRLDLNMSHLKQIRDNYIQIVETYQEKAMEMIKKMDISLEKSEDIKKELFKNEFLVYLKSHHSEDSENRFGKLVIFKHFVSWNKIKFINEYVPFMKIDKLDQDKLDSILLLMKLDEVIQNPELEKHGRKDIWLESDLSVIDPKINHTDYKFLDFHFFKINSLEDDLFEELKNLTQINFNCCCLSQLSSNSFRSVPSLKILQLKSNCLDFLPVDIFQTLPNLVELDLHFNNLTDIEENLFSNLSNLTILGLGHNQIGFIDKNVFNSLTNLKRLDLHANCLRKLKKEWLKNLTQLEILNLSKNFEYSNYGFKFETNLFESLTNLKTLHFSYNLMESFDEDLFDSLKSLEYLDLVKCGLKYKVNEGIFKNLNLKSLFLDSNEIYEINPILKHMTKMQELSLAFNNLKSLSVDFFESFINLKTLDLHNNNLESIKKDWFRNLNNLERLELNWNKIRSLEPGVFVNLINLKYLSLHDNKMDWVKKDVFDGLKNLEIHYDDEMDLHGIIDDRHERNIILVSHKKTRKFLKHEA
ncbi:unnamed protein product [Brachionus calyciflorus]|uniref:Uncharacterized protein n=1 Tax=Brachionus calyciflorus TaxID=104777 RepID=A0A814BUY0_9BILA|nr:unnamed protein product [Brachionus calyciflorus]